MGTSKFQLYFLQLSDFFVWLELQGWKQPFPTPTPHLKDTVQDLFQSYTQVERWDYFVAFSYFMLFFWARGRERDTDKDWKLKSRWKQTVTEMRRALALAWTLACRVVLGIPSSPCWIQISGTWNVVLEQMLSDLLSGSDIQDSK